MDKAFIKMHGLGNDFVVFDARAKPLALGFDQIRRIADRRIGIGCDQVIVIEKPAAKSKADVFMRIYNADGGEVTACGNATRCIGQVLMGESHAESAVIETGAGLLVTSSAPGGLITVDMDKPLLEWQEIPLSRAVDTLHVPLSLGDWLEDPACSNMGNPHATFFVASLDAVPMHEIGPQLEQNPIFPERANIGVAEIVDRGAIRLRVWERGAGLTLACGTGACAALVSAVRRDLTDRTAIVHLDGGDLSVTWHDDTGHVSMTGPAEISYHGRLPDGLLN
jgi:diaminopimelate epimerase